MNDEPLDVFMGCLVFVWIIVWLLFLPTVGILYLTGYLT